MDQNYSPWRQPLGENFIYCLDENKLKRAYDEKTQKELGIGFREKVSWSLVLSGYLALKTETPWVAVKVNLNKVFLHAQPVLQAVGRILVSQEERMSSDANDNGSITRRLL